MEKTALVRRVGSALISIATLSMVVAAQSAHAAEVGITDTEILFGAHSTESGPLADAGWAAIEGYFADINAAGGVHGRKIRYIHEDVGLNVPRAIEVTKKLVEQEKIFAMVYGGISVVHQAVWKYLVEKKVPDVAIADAIPVYLEPFNKTVFMQTGNVYHDGFFAAKYMSKDLKGKKACVLMLNSEVGVHYMNGVTAAITEFNKSASEKERMVQGPTEKIDKAAPNSNAEVLKLKRAGCDAIFAPVFGPAFPAAINFASSQGYKPKWISYSFNSKKNLFDLIKADAREGVLVTQYLQRTPLKENDAVWNKIEDFAKRHKMEQAVSSVPFGMFVGEVVVEALKKAGRDLTRDKFIAALESLKGFKCSTCLMPVELSATNHWPFTYPKMSVWKGDKFVILN